MGLRLAAVAQVRRTGFADETVAAFARLITDGDLAKRALSQSLRGNKCASPVNSFLSWLIAKARVVYVEGQQMNGDSRPNDWRLWT